MKRILLPYLFAFLCWFPASKTVAQSPAILWQRCVGSPYIDYGGQIVPTTDGGSIAVGYVSGGGGDVTGTHGTADYFVVKQDANGAIQWTTDLGGASIDYGSVIRQTPDGGYLVGGEAGSRQGDGSVTTVNNGGLDAWLVKLNSSGNVQWETDFGGAQNEYVGDMKPTADGGYILVGSSQSGAGQVTGNHGNYDIWVVKFASNGTFAWQKCIGGSQDDWGYGIAVAGDGYVVSGWTSSIDGDAVGNKGQHNLLAAKLDLAGNLVWSKALGGTYYDEGYGVETAADGSGYVFAGLARSHDGDVVGNHGAGGWQDAWIVKLDPGGNLLWQHCYGGSANESAWSITATADGGFVVAGSAQSLDGDVSCMPPAVAGIGQLAGWVFKINAAGTLLWNKVISGGYYDFSLYAKESPDGGILVCGYTALSNVPGYHKDVTNTVGDIYVGKLGPAVALSLSITTPPVNICNGATVTLTTNLTGTITGMIYHWIKNGVDQGVNAATYSSSSFANGDVVYCEVTAPGDACSPGQTATSNSVTLSVSPTAAPTISISSPVATICAEAPLQFTSAVTGGSPAGTYQWQVNGSPAGAGGAVFNTQTLNDGDIVTCVYSDNTVCVVTGQLISNSIAIHVNPVIPVSVNITADTLAVCDGGSVHFGAVAGGGGNAPSFQWLVNGSPAAAASGLSTFSSNSLANGDVVSCQLTSSAACPSPAVASSNSLTVSVKPVLTSTISVGVAPMSVCSGEPMVFTANVQAAGTSPDFQWSVNGNSTGGNSSVFRSSSLNNGDVISCTVSDPAQCVIASQQSVTATVYPTPVVGTVAPVLVSKGQSVTLQLPVTGIIATYAWSPGTWLNDSTVADPLATPVQTTRYLLTVTTADGCSDTGSILVKVYSRLAIPGAFTPNGDGHNDIFYVVGGPLGSRIADLAVYDRYGQVVFQVHGAPPDDPAYGWNGTIDGRPGSPGVYVYMLRLRLADGTEQVMKGTVILVR